MAMLSVLLRLAFYGTTLALYLVVTAAQILNPVRDAKVSAAALALKLLGRLVLAVLFYAPVLGICGRLVGDQLLDGSRIRRRMIEERVFTNASRSTVTSPTSPRSSAFQDAQSPTKSSHSPEVSPTPPQKTPLTAEALQDQGDDRPSWEGIIGFFHPFCNAGGGGERVLWAAIKATQEKHPLAVCVVYTGDHDASKPQIIARVKDRFNIELDSTKVFFLYLSSRRYVLASTWPHFTLLGQSLGSIVLAFDAFQLLVPDIFVDTMGYGFALGFARFLFPSLPIGAYIHYPTISTDMLGSLDMEEGKGLHAGAGRGWRGMAKKLYWRIFAWAYGFVGGTVDVVMTNSSWTCAHIRSIWGPRRPTSARKSEIEVVFPPSAVEELEEAIAVDAISENRRENIFLCIAQFRPEKNHKMLLEAFAEFVSRAKESGSAQNVKLALIGSVRDSEDATRVYELRLLAHELKIKEEVEFICDASWSEILQWLQKSTAGVNGMWNEHFGIGVVEYQAAGLVSVVNNSGGPKLDIVVDYDGEPTGFHASSTTEYADAFEKVLAMKPRDKLAMRLRARQSAKRFTEAEFAKGWNKQADKLIALQQQPPPKVSSREEHIVAGSYVSLLGYDIYKLLFR